MKASPSASTAGHGRLWHRIAAVTATLLAALPIRPAAAGALLEGARAGPLANVGEIVFAVRGVAGDGHWYANFGRYAPQRLCETPLYPTGSSLRAFNPATGTARMLLEDARGSIRDPQVHYDGKKILFSYRPGGTEHYHLHEILTDGSGLRRLTDGPWDDIEPTYLANGDIVFVSSRCNRWVNCWLTPVATLHRCRGDGSGIRPISPNIEHDNTPWPLPDGRLLYTRWEYVDRSQVHYHHLWTMNPDGTAPMTFYGNLKPGLVMIDAKPVPGSPRVVAVFSPGHGDKEHAGPLALVDPRPGPDADQGARMIHSGHGFRDPWAFAENCVVAARGNQLVLLDGKGGLEVMFTLDEAESRAGRWCHEPRPIAPRPREAVVTDRTNPQSPTGVMTVMDTRIGRNMEGVGEGEITQLLVLESLPKPINYTGGMEPLSYGGTFTLERVLGTVPVEADGSAHFEVPANRSIFFVALDARGRSVKRMQSFTGVQPGESLGCIGCHENRASAPPAVPRNATLAALRPPSPIQAFAADIPDVFDFPRDIQPILDRHCVECHDENQSRGGVILTGDRGPLYSHAYFSLTVTGQLADGRNEPKSNYPPRALGSGSAPFLSKLEGGHHGVTASPREQLVARLWIDTGAPYPGTYAGLGSGMIGGYEMNEQVIENDAEWLTTRAGMAVINQRCAPCHQQAERPLPRTLSDEIGFSFWMPDLKDQRIRRNRHIVFNLSRPERSLMLLAPLAKSAGGHGTCRNAGQAPREGAVLTSDSDPDWQTLLAMIRAGRDRLNEVKRFDMPGFQPRPEWIAEMRRCGVLPAATGSPAAAIDCYAVERTYWQSLHHQPTPVPAP